jgi:acetoin:2,6-dichlorophenolindophenol oxidoreductase subunit beta
MAKKTIREAISQTIRAEMERDPNLIILGEDIVGGNGTAGGPEAIGGIWGLTGGLYSAFGPKRVIDTPISESCIVGAAAGAALAGKRAIAELMFADFVGVCLDQIYNQIAKFRYMFGGRSTCPVTIRIVYGAGLNCAAQHSQAVYSMLTSIPGLKVVMPTTPADAKGLLTTAIRGDDPVMFFEHKILYGETGEVPDGDYLVPFGHARVVREGGDATIVSCGALVGAAATAADRLAADGIACEVLDLRTTSPLDEESILDSVEATGRLIVADESPPRCSLAADISALVCNKAFAALEAPIELVTAAHSPVPFARELERAYLPNAATIEAAVRKALAYR